MNQYGQESIFENPTEGIGLEGESVPEGSVWELGPQPGRVADYQIRKGAFLIETVMIDGRFCHSICRFHLGPHGEQQPLQKHFFLITAFVVGFVC